jgi:hypothetical protein
LVTRVPRPGFQRGFGSGHPGRAASGCGDFRYQAETAAAVGLISSGCYPAYVAEPRDRSEWKEVFIVKSATCRSYRPRWAVPLTVGLILIAVPACSSGSPSPGVANAGSATPTASQTPGGAQGSGSQGGSQLGSGGLTVAFSECMRSHGEPKFPDPNSQGVVGSLIQLGIDPNSPQFQAARKVCAHLANGPEPGGQQSQSQNTAAALKFASCMRSHGFPHFPDPNSNGSISGSSSDGINPASPQYQSAQKACSQQTGYGKGATKSSGS